VNKMSMFEQKTCIKGTPIAWLMMLDRDVKIVGGYSRSCAIDGLRGMQVL